ncbi:MAG: PQQ-binding-like beta-propeller repeat protein, partial [Aureliella sp.]
MLPVVATTACAQDWPQIMGPERSGQATGQAELSTSWPKAPNIAWQADIGSGYAGPAVVGEQVLALHRLGQEEMLESFDLSSGESQWRATWPASYRSSIDPDNGPRCVPTVVSANATSDSSTAICYGAAGDLTAVDLNSGKLRWHRKLRSEYRADDGYFGAGCAPLVVGQRVIVCLGGKQAGIVAVNL